METTYNFTPVAGCNSFIPVQINLLNTSRLGENSSMYLSSNGELCDLVNRSKTLDVADTSKDHYNSYYIRYTTLVFYLLTFICGIIGNSLVLFVITRYDRVRVKSVANYYIWNLAFADELFIFTIPFFCFATFKQDWIFGQVACKIAFFLRECNKFASVFTLMALSIDRYLATYHNLSGLRTVRVGKIVCVCIWIACVASCVPYWCYSHTAAITSGTRNSTSCDLDWPSFVYRQVWTYLQLVLGLVFPLTVIATFNILLLWRLHKMVRPGTSATTSSAGRASSNMTRTVLTIVVIFMVCQIPYYVKEVISLKVVEHVIQEGVPPSNIELSVLIHVNMLSTILVFISSCVNPVVYGLCNKNYRSLYKQVLCCGCARRDHVTVSRVEMTGLSLTRQPSYGCKVASAAAKKSFCPPLCASASDPVDL